MSDDCGCCATPPSGPSSPGNRPGLPAIAYRLGTFASFRRAMLERLSSTAELSGLATRVSDDYTITAIELWSAVADVLTFYQERTANEAFLRTATLRDSMLRLVRLIDYELAPGAAATTQIAFTLEAGATALIPAGTRIQSVPRQGEQPQKFEMLAPIQADARRNRLRIFPAPTPATPTGPGSSSAIVAPDAGALAAASTLSPGDQVLLYAPGAVEVLTVRELAARDDLLTLRWREPVSQSGFEAAFDASQPDQRAYKLGRSFHLFGYDAPPLVVVAAQKDPNDATTGYLAAAQMDFTLHGDGSSDNQIALDARYPGLKPGSTVVAVAVVSGGLTVIPFCVAAARDAHVSRGATTDGGTKAAAARSGLVTQLDLVSLDSRKLGDLLPSGDIRDVVVYEALGEPLRFWPYTYADTINANEVLLPGRRAGWSSIEVGRSLEKGVTKPGAILDVTQFTPGAAVLLSDDAGGVPVAATIAGASLVGASLTFGPTASDQTTVARLGLAPDQVTPLTVIASPCFDEKAKVALPNGPRQLTVTIGTLPPQTIALGAALGASATVADVASALQSAIRAALPGAPTFEHALAWEMSSGHASALVVAPGVAGDRVVFGASPSDPATVAALGLDAPRARYLDGVVSAPIARLDSFGSEVSGEVRVASGIDAFIDRGIRARLSSVASLAVAVRLALKIRTQVTSDGRIIALPPLARYEPRAYIRLALAVDTTPALDTATAVLLGNVAPASHGETVADEIIGDGDASQPFQRFPLKKKPVTYVPAAVPGGVVSSLRLFVNGVKWDEVPSLYAAGSRDQVYATRVADDGTLTVEFGDGNRGARPPSGRQNLVARYRQGTGLAGRVGAGTLTTLLDRPTGVKSATNLIAADGGADPETLAGARAAAPGTVRTFGRAVSLRDFEDASLLAGEVAKARATWVWAGDRRVVHLTVAGQRGATFSDEGLKRLAATLATERDPNHKLVIANYLPVAMLVDAALVVKERSVNSDVLAAARAALLDALSFDRRALAEPVYLSDVYRILQNVEGVLAVDVNVLDLKNQDAGFRFAHGIDGTRDGPQPHLLMLPSRPVASSGTIQPAELAVVEVPAQDVVLTASGGVAP